MFTKWQQVEDWLLDNRCKRWIFYKSDPEKSDERGNNKILDSKYWADDPIEEKIRLTKKYLEQWGSRAYGLAFQNESANSGGVQCVVYIEQAQQPVQVQQPQAPVAGMSGMGIGAADMEQLKSQIREQIETEFEKKEYERKRKEFDEEKRQFEQDKNSAIGLMVGYLKPVISALGQKRVAGLDAEDDVRAERVRPIEHPTTVEQEEVVEDVEQQVFTDEEGDKLFALMARFKQVEPEYMQLLESVVAMAESNDGTYQMARGFLLKKIETI